MWVPQYDPNCSMYFPDLDTCYYDRGPLDADRWAVPLRAIGWLEHPHPFTTGTVPAALLGRLVELILQMDETFSHYSFRGVHHCDLCAAAGMPAFAADKLNVNLLIPGDGEVFAATGTTPHYIEAHSYRPPDSFVSAVLTCPPADSAEYLAALRGANKGRAIPLLTRDELDRQMAIAFHIGLRFIEQLGGPPVLPPRQPLNPHLEKLLDLFSAHVEDPQQVRRQAEVAQRFRAALAQPLLGAPREAVVRAAQIAQPDWVAVLRENQIWFGPATIHFSKGVVSSTIPNTDWPI